MTLVLANAMLVDPEADTVSAGSLIVKDGKIAGRDSGGEHPSDADVIDCNGKFLAPGIVDIGVKIGEPGERHKESFRTAGQAAAAGGITTIVTRPDTNPPLDNPETLEFYVRKARAATAVRVRPMATLTKGRQGKEISEIGLLSDAGAVAFSDCDLPVRDARTMTRCLAYAKQFGKLVVGHPQDPDLSANAAATAGSFAFMKGLPAVPPVAERMGLERDLALVEFTGAGYHADQLTVAESISVMERALDAGLDVSAGVSVHHLTLNELDVSDFRTFFKVKPPLRSEEDRQAMVLAVSKGIISVISSMHTPQDEESKRLPFAQAASGAVALETTLPATLRLHHSGDLSLPALFRALSFNPARRLGLDCGRLAVGTPADVILFDPDVPFVLDRFKLKSKSKNTPFDNQLLQGRVLRTFVAGKEIHGSCCGF